MKQSLEQRGATVVLSRPDEVSIGTCVDARAIAANNSGADLVVGIHADGAAAHERGFHICYSAPALNPVQAGPSVALAERPSILIELGNLRHADDAARMSSLDGRRDYAMAISVGIETFLPAD
ncbi:N-acetylmuramoyl-L-alanine amidase [Rhodococcus sp. 27YEA15]